MKLSINQLRRIIRESANWEGATPSKEAVTNVWWFGQELKDNGITTALEIIRQDIEESRNDPLPGEPSYPPEEMVETIHILQTLIQLCEEYT